MTAKLTALAAFAALCLAGAASAQAQSQAQRPSAPPPPRAEPMKAEYIDLRWDGVDRMCVVYPDGHVDFVGKDLKSIQRPDDADKRAFYMTIALNRLVAAGYQPVFMISDEILLTRQVPR